MTNNNYRCVTDSIGEIKIPNYALYGAETQRAIYNFPISGQKLSKEHIEVMAKIKKAAAEVNYEYKIINKKQKNAIIKTVKEIIDRKHDNQFPVDIFQTGSGTSSNMNMNEVITTIATKLSNEKIHPNDHVNASQSSNDVFPSSATYCNCSIFAKKSYTFFRRTCHYIRKKGKRI